MKNIWCDLPRPILVQAPMEGVTDTVFRQIIASCGKPDIFFTEFTNVDAIVRGTSTIATLHENFYKPPVAPLRVCNRCSWAALRREHVGLKNFVDSRLDGFINFEILRRLRYSEAERPIVAQIWGNTPENYYRAVKLVAEMGFNGVDINMGCPVWGVVKKGYCAGLIKNQKLAKKIILAAKEAANGKIPVSVKTRIGYEKAETEGWVGFLLGQGLDAITIHGRTAKDRSRGPTDWEEIGKAVLLRNKLRVKTAIIGNGDVKSREEAWRKREKYEVDGVMIGRGILENPWVFSPTSPQGLRGENPKDKMSLLIKHINLFMKTYGKGRNFAIMKKFYKTYVNGFRGASKLREELMELKNAEETINKIKVLHPFAH